MNYFVMPLSLKLRIWWLGLSVFALIGILSDPIECQMNLLLSRTPSSWPFQRTGGIFELGLVWEGQGQWEWRPGRGHLGPGLASRPHTATATSPRHPRPLTSDTHTALSCEKWNWREMKWVYQSLSSPSVLLSVRPYIKWYIITIWNRNRELKINSVPLI